MTDASLLSTSEEILLADTIQTLKVFCGMVLLAFAKHSQAMSDTVIRNFIARGMACTDSIFLVWQHGSEQDAWILHRTLLDRLFHLHHLAENNEFEVFEKYSFMRSFEARQQLLSDSTVSDRVPKSLSSIQQSHEARYQELLNEGTQWRRPKAEKVAKSMELGFLYHYGYNFASTHVHPMASDGETDFLRLISSEHQQPAADVTVVRNSILVLSLLIQGGLNASSLRWRKIVFDFLDQTRGFLSDGSLEFRATLFKIVRAWPEFELCEPSVPAGGGT